MGQRQLQRVTFVTSFNLTFGPAQVAATARRLGSHVAAMDAIEIVARLGLLTWVRPEDFFEYRDKVGIPPLGMRILTEALHAALLAPGGPMPIVLEIAEGPAEAVSVAIPGRQVEIKLTRTTFERPAEAR